MEVARPDQTQEFVAYEHIGLVTALAERVDMRMFHISSVCPAPMPAFFASSSSLNMRFCISHTAPYSARPTYL